MTTDTGHWSVKTTGKLMAGFDTPAVLANFVQTFGVSEEKAQGYFQAGKLIKKDLSQAAAEAYQDNLNRMGLDVVIADESQPGVNPAESAAKASPAGLSLAPVGDEQAPAAMPAASVAQAAAAQSALSVAPVKDAEGNAVAGPFTCPKCSLAQPRSDVCIGCGVVFAKLDAIDGESVSHSRTASSSSARYMGEEQEGLNLMALLSAAVVALICAFVWKFVALQFGVESGFVAWIAGGAIGAAAVVAGGSGTVTGTTCAVLVVLSIFGGKFMYTSEFVNDARAYLEGADAEGWLEEVDAQIKLEREIFASVGNDERSIKQFMIDHDYTEATHISMVPDDDYDYFLEEIIPWLQESASAEDGIDDYGNEEPTLAAALEELSTWDLVMESLNLKDLIFLILGIATAFRLGRDGFAT